ncbi:MAG: hypothetical protein R3C97_06315 [Geminicoccaceae bacterium]
MTKPSTNKLLVAMTALGLTAAASDVSAAPSYGSFGEFFSYVSTTMSNDLRGKVDFVRNYPNSPQAAVVAREIAAQLSTMGPAARASAMSEIRSTGGLPGAVASVAGLADLATAGIGPRNRARDVVSQNTNSAANSSIY